MIDQETFENAHHYSWLTPAGDAVGEFTSVDEADCFPNLEPDWILLAFDSEGNEL